MSIFTPNPDPDYPVSGGPGFAQHTCNYGQVQQQQPQFYFNGQTVSPVAFQPQVQTSWFGQLQQPVDSRRYDSQPVQIQQPVNVPAPAPTLGFNQLVEESRRNQQPVAPAPVQQQSMWGVQPSSQVQQCTYQAPQFNPAPSYTPAMNPDYSALYTLHPSFDKKHGVWGDTALMTPVAQPTIQWGAAPSVTPTNVPPYGQMNSIAYPSQIQPNVSTNWEQLALRNFNQTNV